MKKIKLTKNQEEFIGTQFPTPKGGILTVVGKGNTTNSNGHWDQKFILECSICSEDTELWYLGSIRMTKDKLKTKIPCNCTTGKVRWTREQYETRINRECERRGYNFLGFVGTWKGNSTKLNLHNPVTGNTWKSTRIDNLFTGNGDPAQRIITLQKVHTKEDSTHIEKFIKVGFTGKHVFIRSARIDSQGRKTYWNVICPICSQDDYVQAGLCNGIFESQHGNLKLGKKPCRCNEKSYRWTQGQREYQIQKIFNIEGGSFTGWSTEGGYQNTNHSKFNWLCSVRHECITSVNDFVNCNVRCPHCDKIKRKVEGCFNGYYPNRTEEQDNLYVIDFGGSYIKVGRAFDIEARFKGSKGLLKASNRNRDQIEILTVLTGTHQEIYDLEQEIHEELRERGFEYTDETWSTELFTSDSKDIIYRLCGQSRLPEGKGHSKSPINQS